RISPFKDEQGLVLWWVGTLTDIEEYKQAAEAVSRSERRYRALVQATPQVVWGTSPAGQADAAAWWEQLTGQAVTGGDSPGWLEVVHPEDRERVGAAWQSALACHSAYTVEYRVRDRG